MLSESQNIIYKEFSWTPAMLMQKHSSFPRNHNIANAFYKAGFVESWGRGFKKIAEEFEKAKFPLPTIEEDCGGVMAVIQRRTVDEIIQERESDYNNTDNVGANVGVNIRNQAELNLSERQKVIRTIIKSNPTITVKQMSETLAVNKRTVERDLAVMQKAGIIRHEGADKTGTWIVLEQKK